ncbi:MAG: RDD family protein [Terriglobales bacterium]
MKSRFQPDTDSAPRSAPKLIDPEAYDVSEQQFAASLDAESVPPLRFEAQYAEPAVSMPEDSSPVVKPAEEAAGPGGESALAEAGVAGAGQAPDPDSWRREVAARVNHYRGKRPRAPHYPSLQLKFESSEPPMTGPPSVSRPLEAPTHGQLAITLDIEPAAVRERQTPPPIRDLSTVPQPDSGTKVLTFPRSSFMPPVVADELAEPVFDRPRILEVPEVLPPPPAMGGISIEPSESPADERRPGFELPLKSAPMSRRILAGATDAMIVAAAFAGFAYIFVRITAIVPPLPQAVEVATALLAGFWAGYQYLLLVYAGSTPGLKLAGLELSRFNGCPVPRKLRRWRVLASMLSGLSLALGYAWCFMDEDELCWHDRITHTYMAPKSAKPAPVSTSH